MKHSFIYVLELGIITTPSKARLAFIHPINQCKKFHCYCRHCGVRLIGKNITKLVLGVGNQQPSCADYTKIQHKHGCQSLLEKTTSGGDGGGGTTTPTDGVFIPEYLTFEKPKFVIKPYEAEAPDEIDMTTIKAAPKSLNIPELENPNSTYLLNDVLDAYFYIEHQISTKLQQVIKQKNITENAVKIQESTRLKEQTPKIQLGNKGYQNRYGYLVKEITELYSTVHNPVIYSGKFELKYTKITDKAFIFRPIKTLYFDTIENDDKTCFYKIGNLIINIERSIYAGTMLGKSIDNLSKMKKNQAASSDVIIDFYITGHELPTDYNTKINDNKNEINDYVVNIINHNLIVIKDH